jgi:pimeloyl-ACP methyl ester carboxylesterase
MSALPPLDSTALPTGVKSRFIDNVNGLRMHILEAGNDDGRPLLLLLHGFPELAYTWRKVMMPFAKRGYYVIAPDQRGYGRTTGTEDNNDDDFTQFSMLNSCQDIVTLLYRLGKTKVRSVIGRDLGSPVAANLALLRPDIFESVVMISAPYFGAPPIDTPSRTPVIDALRQLGRKHYRWYFSSVKQADSDMINAGQGLKEFFRGYFYFKSAQHPKNKNIFELKEWTADELCKLPEYYVMQLDSTMPQTVLSNVPDSAVLQREMSSWLTEDELQMYTDEYQRSSFRGGLQYYKCMTSGYDQNQLKVFSGMKIKCPATFICGANDWGMQMEPGFMKKLGAKDVFEDWRGLELIDDAGHWLTEEQPEELIKAILKFLNEV